MEIVGCILVLGTIVGTVGGQLMWNETAREWFDPTRRYG
jgi:hypothetical protein